jgi:hypothetical protein
VNLPHDPVLPQMATALDARAMAGVFAALVDRTVLLEGCEIERIKYRPRRNLAVAYRLALRRDGLAFEQRVATRFCSGGEAARRHAKALQGACVPSAAGPAVSHDPALDMVAQWWPNDAKLAAAHSLADTASLREHWLPQVLAALGRPPQALRSHRLEIVQAVPEHRVTARVDLRWADAQTAAEHTETVYAKADAECRGPRTHAVMQALWAGAARREGRLPMPRPLLWQPASGLHWQSAVGGRALLDIAPQVGDAHGARAGALLAALHASPAAAAPAWTLSELRERLHHVVAVLGSVQPAPAGLAVLAGALAQELPHLAAQAWVTLHGDLHPRNMLFDGSQLGLIDFDSVRAGPAALDVGAWLADALYRAALAGVPASQALHAAHAFVQGYETAGGARLGERALAWSTAYQLLCQRVWRCVVNLKPGRFALVPSLLSLAQAVLREGSVWAAHGAALEAA